MNDDRYFPMLDGPWIPWSTAQLIFEAYDRLYGSEGLDLERFAARGGFSWDEVPTIFSDLKRRDRKLWNELQLRSGRTQEDIRREDRVR